MGEVIERQGADITDNDVDFLIRVFVWGEHSYEFANFTDAELADVVVVLATEQEISGAQTADWRQRAERELANARSSHQDAGVAIGKMRVRANQPRLAELLWPAPLHAVEAAESGQSERRPVHDLVRMVNEIVVRLSASGYVLEQPSTRAEKLE